MCDKWAIQTTAIDIASQNTARDGGIFQHRVKGQGRKFAWCVLSVCHARYFCINHPNLNVSPELGFGAESCSCRVGHGLGCGSQVQLE